MYGLNGLEHPGFRWGHAEKPQPATHSAQAHRSPHTRPHAEEAAAFSLNPQPAAALLAQSPPPLPRPLPGPPHTAPLPLWLHRVLCTHTSPATSHPLRTDHSPLLSLSPVSPKDRSHPPGCPAPPIKGLCSLLPPTTQSSLTSQNRSNTRKSTPSPVLCQLQTSTYEPASILRGLGSWKGRTGAAAQGFRHMIAHP